MKPSSSSSSAPASSSTASKLGSAADDFTLVGHSELKAFVADANEAVNFKLLRKYCEKGEEGKPACTKEEPFNPEMSHQVYGDTENIFGYRDLSVDVDMTAATLKTRISFDCEETMKEKDGVKPDPVLEPLIKILAENQVAKNEDEFKSEFEKDKKFKPFGKKLSEYATKSGETGEDEVYEIYACEGSESGFKEYHERMQPWILFYIDAASYIDFDDANWRFFVVYERFKDPDGGEARYAFAGYTTVYQYYAYPANIRPRVSQMLVLPPFQRRGLGAKMLDVVQQYYWGNEKVIDITVEDPSDDFVRLRDFVDCTNCATLDAFSPQNLHKGYSAAMVKECNQKFKICRRQSRRVYEILRMRAVEKGNKQQLLAFKEDVKARLSKPFLKEDRQLEKLKRALKPEEYTAATINMTNKEQREEQVKTQFEALESHFLRIVERLPAAAVTANGSSSNGTH